MSSSKTVKSKGKGKEKDDFKLKIENEGIVKPEELTKIASMDEEIKLDQVDM